MKFCAVAYLVAHVFSNAISDSLKANNLKREPPQNLNEALYQLLEDVITQMACGWPDNGIPPLTPLLLDHVDQVLELDGTHLQFVMDNVEVHDLDSLTIKRFNLNPWTLRLDFEFTYHRVKILADKYVANGKLVLNPVVDRSGHFEMDLFDIDIIGHAQFGYINFFFYNLQELVTDVSVGNARANIGSLGGRSTNEFLNFLLENQIPAIVNQNSKAISNALSNAALPKANAILNRMTLTDLINLFRNLGSVSDCVPVYASRMGFFELVEMVVVEEN